MSGSELTHDGPIEEETGMSLPLEVQALFVRLRRGAVAEHVALPKTSCVAGIGEDDDGARWLLTSRRWRRDACVGHFGPFCGGQRRLGWRWARSLDGARRFFGPPLSEP